MGIVLCVRGEGLLLRGFDPFFIKLSPRLRHYFQCLIFTPWAYTIFNIFFYCNALWDPHPYFSFAVSTMD